MATLAPVQNWDVGLLQYYKYVFYNPLFEIKNGQSEEHIKETFLYTGYLELFTTLQKSFGDGGSANTLQKYLDCDLLVLDDMLTVKENLLYRGALYLKTKEKVYEDRESNSGPSVC